MISVSEIHLILLKDCLFLKNIVKEQILTTKNVIIEKIINTSCMMNNQENSDYIYLGGCFKSYNVKYRTYSNITIDSGYSDYTTIGLKIIDEEIFIESDNTVNN